MSEWKIPYSFNFALLDVGTYLFPAVIFLFWLWKTLQHYAQKQKSDPQSNTCLSFTKHSTELHSQVKNNRIFKKSHWFSLKNKNVYPIYTEIPVTSLRKQIYKHSLNMKLPTHLKSFAISVHIYFSIFHLLAKSYFNFNVSSFFSP